MYSKFLFSSTLLLLFFLADRLPIHLGSFISGKVYDGKLQSEHEIEDYSCIAFIDVWKGEEMRRGNSYLVSKSTRSRISWQVDEWGTIEHGGGPYGYPDRSTISSTQARFLHHHVLRPSTSSYHQSFRECGFTIGACPQRRQFSGYVPRVVVSSTMTRLANLKSVVCLCQGTRQIM